MFEKGTRLNEGNDLNVKPPKRLPSSPQILPRDNE